jgi:hypothetical protein
MLGELRGTIGLYGSFGTLKAFGGGALDLSGGAFNPKSLPCWMCMPWILICVI